MNNQKWTIKYVNEFNEPYYNINDNNNHRHLNIEEWQMETPDEVIQVAKDFLDVPEGKLSLEQIKKDFGTNQLDVDESKYVQIQNYYNGRLALFDHLKDEVLTFKDLINLKDADITNYKVFHYSIPVEYNSFYMTDEEKSEQTQGYIEIVFNQK